MVSALMAEKRGAKFIWYPVEDAVSSSGCILTIHSQAS